VSREGDALAYDRSYPLDVRWAGTRTVEGGSIAELTYLAVPSQRRAAYLVRPDGDGPFPAILYVHWYEPQACDSHRSQFLGEAESMMRRGVISLLIETMWSDRDWFLKRTQADDFAASAQQTIELRRAADLLLSQPGADGARFAYVGHDFGAMYGVVMGSVDARPCCYVLMAGTPRFSDWYLYYPRVSDEDRQAFIRDMAPLDPHGRVEALAPAPLLFQFGRSDPHVPPRRAEDFFDAAGEPKTVQWYDAGHALNEDAARDRERWLQAQLGIE